MGNYAENEPFSTAERSERVENFLFRATREYMAASIEQATDALAPTVQNRAVTRCPNVTHERRRPAAIKPHVSDFPGASLVLAQAKRACAVQLAHPPPPPLFADSRLRVSFPCICSPPVCIIRSVTSLSLTTTTWTPEHPFFSTHCYPNTSSGSGRCPKGATSAIARKFWWLVRILDYAQR